MSTIKRTFAAFIEIIEIAAIAIIAVILIRNFLVQPFLVNGASMEPNFSNNDYLLVDELSYLLRSPERGEVVVFRYPGDRTIFYIKRIIALPGEKIKLNNDTIVIFNDEYPEGDTLDEAYLSLGLVTHGDSEIILGENEYFVLGDNRSQSFDSRSWGPLPKENLIGLVRLRLWPLSKVSAFERPAY